MTRIGKLQGNPKGWRYDDQEHYLGNPSFGRIQIVAVYDNNGKENHHRPLFLQHWSEHYVVVNQEQKIAFVEVERPTMLPPNLYTPTWEMWRPSPNGQMLIPHPADICTIGLTELELPAGLAEGDSLKEAEEETGFQVEHVAYLGQLNSDPPFYATAPFLHLCRALPIPSQIPQDPNEPIIKVHWLTPEQTRELETYSAPTYAGLCRFRLWALKQQDAFWYDIGERL